MATLGFTDAAIFMMDLGNKIVPKRHTVFYNPDPQSVLITHASRDGFVVGPYDASTNTTNTKKTTTIDHNFETKLYSKIRAKVRAKIKQKSNKTKIFGAKAAGSTKATLELQTPKYDTGYVHAEHRSDLFKMSRWYKGVQSALYDNKDTQSGYAASISNFCRLYLFDQFQTLAKKIEKRLLPISSPNPSRASSPMSSPVGLRDKGTKKKEGDRDKSADKEEYKTLNNHKPISEVNHLFETCGILLPNAAATATACHLASTSASTSVYEPICVFDTAAISTSDSDSASDSLNPAPYRKEKKSKNTGAITKIVEIGYKDDIQLIAVDPYNYLEAGIMDFEVAYKPLLCHTPCNTPCFTKSKKNKRLDLIELIVRLKKLEQSLRRQKNVLQKINSNNDSKLKKICLRKQNLRCFDSFNYLQKLKLSYKQLVGNCNYYLAVQDCFVNAGKMFCAMDGKILKLHLHNNPKSIFFEQNVCGITSYYRLGQKIFIYEQRSIWTNAEDHIFIFNIESPIYLESLSLLWEKYTKMPLIDYEHRPSPHSGPEHICTGLNVVMQFKNKNLYKGNVCFDGLTGKITIWLSANRSECVNSHALIDNTNFLLYVHQLLPEKSQYYSLNALLGAIQLGADEKMWLPSSDTRITVHSKSSYRSREFLLWVHIRKYIDAALYAQTGYAQTGYANSHNLVSRYSMDNSSDNSSSDSLTEAFGDTSSDSSTDTLSDYSCHPLCDTSSDSCNIAKNCSIDSRRSDSRRSDNADSWTRTSVIKEHIYDRVTEDDDHHFSNEDDHHFSNEDDNHFSNEYDYYMEIPDINDYETKTLSYNHYEVVSEENKSTYQQSQQLQQPQRHEKKEQKEQKEQKEKEKDKENGSISKLCNENTITSAMGFSIMDDDEKISAGACGYDNYDDFEPEYVADPVFTKVSDSHSTLEPENKLSPKKSNEGETISQTENGTKKQTSLKTSRTRLDEENSNCLHEDEADLDYMLREQLSKEFTKTDDFLLLQNKIDTSQLLPISLLEFESTMSQGITNVEQTTCLSLDASVATTKSTMSSSTTSDTSSSTDTKIETKIETKTEIENTAGLLSDHAWSSHNKKENYQILKSASQLNLPYQTELSAEYSIAVFAKSFQDMLNESAAKTQSPYFLDAFELELQSNAHTGLYGLELRCKTMNHKLRTTNRKQLSNSRYG